MQNTRRLKIHGWLCKFRLELYEAFFVPLRRNQLKSTALDIFERIKKNRGPLGQHSKESHGYFSFPKLEGELGAHMTFRGKPVLVWSLNNYIGLANHPDVRKVDTEAAAQWGMAYPMGARMMSGQTKYHEQLEADLASFMGKEDSFLLNFGYQGCMSAIECLVGRHDVIVYDSECHACMVDGVRLHNGKRFVFQHNDMESFAKQLKHAKQVTDRTGGGILVLTEGVFGMAGDMSKLKEIVKYKDEYGFRLFIDDAHGFGTIGDCGRGAADVQGVQDKVDVYFGTFAKAMATIGAFVASEAHVVEYMRYNMRSQTFAKSLPLPIVIGAIKRLEMMRTQPKLQSQLWHIAKSLQDGLKVAGFDIGHTDSVVTPVFMKGTLGEATNVTLDLRETYGIFCSIVVYPVVPKDVIMLRLIPTVVHTLEDVTYTIESFKKVREKLEAGQYKAEKIASWA
ncbi:MAG: aminotransferase class I/II-fold pyridoxal phosphate-dependent enzyme [Flavobacteriales bacterium]|nr:aminotransferase class I/II-fold pyridoxal phosphate-dependent enzyme [Flavobacteriales bacterium]